MKKKTTHFIRTEAKGRRSHKDSCSKSSIHPMAFLHYIRELLCLWNPPLTRGGDTSISITSSSEFCGTCSYGTRPGLRDDGWEDLSGWNLHQDNWSRRQEKWSLISVTSPLVWYWLVVRLQRTQEFESFLYLKSFISDVRQMWHFKRDGVHHVFTIEVAFEITTPVSGLQKNYTLASNLCAVWKVVNKWTYLYLDLIVVIISELWLLSMDMFLLQTVMTRLLLILTSSVYDHKGAIESHTIAILSNTTKYPISFLFGPPFQQRASRRWKGQDVKCETLVLLVLLQFSLGT